MVVTTFKQNSDLYVGASQYRAQPLHLQPAAHARAPDARCSSRPSISTWLVEHAARSVCARRGHHPRARGARRLQPGPAQPAAGASGSASGSSSPTSCRRRSCSFPFSRLVSMLGLQNSSHGPWSSSIRPSPCPSAPGSSWASSNRSPRRWRSRRWSTAAAGLGAIWRMVLPLVGARPPHRRHLRDHPGRAGIRLQPDLHLLGAEDDGECRRARGPRPRRRLLLGLADGRLPRSPAIPIAILYNFFLDRFIAGFTVGAVR